jgi:hypothetical protein
VCVANVSKLRAGVKTFFIFFEHLQNSARHQSFIGIAQHALSQFLGAFALAANKNLQ